MTLQPRIPHLPRAAALLASLLALSCHDLESFDTKDGQAYCGSVGLADFQDGFVPTGEEPDLALALTLDTSKLTSEPGSLRSNNTATSLCQNPRQALFQDAPLRAIPAVDRDVLSALSFGEGHEHDFFVWVDSSCQGTLLGVVSLLKNDQVELRLFKPARLTTPDAPAGLRAGFAVFHMTKSKPGPNADPKKPCGKF